MNWPLSYEYPRLGGCDGALLGGRNVGKSYQRFTPSELNTEGRNRSPERVASLWKRCQLHSASKITWYNFLFEVTIAVTFH